MIPLRTLGMGAALAAACAAAPASAASRVTPYLEVQQVLDADLNGGGDTLTYTQVSAGVDASISSRRVTATINYRYDRRIPWNHHLGDDNVHTGLARASVAVVPKTLTVEAGAIATRARSDIRGAAPIFFTGDNSNVSQVYGGYVGPSLTTHAGPLQIGASYRLGYVHVDETSGVALAPGQPRIGTLDSAVSHDLTASVGMPSGDLPFGWTVSGGYSRETTHQLSQRFEQKYVRGDLVLPVAPTLALTAGVGYEAIKVSERAILRDAAGLPLVDGHGRYRSDTTSPRLLAYDQTGLIYDAGVIWKPNRHTTLVARAGHRYGGTTVTGTLNWRTGRRSGLQVNVYDGIESVGRLLTQNLNSLPTTFELQRNPLLDNVGGCVFGTTPGTGGCLNDALQSLNGANFRSRGVTALYSVGRGPWTFGVGGGYARRKYIAPVQGNFFTIDGLKDESWIVQGNAARQLSADSGINAAIFADWYKSGIANAGDVSSVGGTASYYRTFGRHLSATASAGIYSYDQHGIDNVVSGQLLLGVRYEF